MKMVSVIVPVYNVEPFLRRCLDSILSQSYENIEVILVDDHSTDNSLSICQEYTSRDSRLSLIQRKVNQGLGPARNSGLEKASGAYVLFVDSDDYIEKNMISNLYRTMIDNHADTVIAGFKRVSDGKCTVEKNRYSGNVYSGEEIKTNVLEKFFGGSKAGGMEMSVWKTLFSLDIIHSNQIQFPNRDYISEDIIFDISYFTKAKKVAISEDTSYCYCYNGSSLTHQYREDRFEAIKFQTTEMRRLCESFGGGKGCRQGIDFYLAGNTLHHIKTLIVQKRTIGKRQCFDFINQICRDEIWASVEWKTVKKTFRLYEKISCMLLQKKLGLCLYIYLTMIVAARGFTK